MKAFACSNYAAYLPVSKSLDIICKICLESGEFLSEWKKVKVVPVYKKERKKP